MTLCASRLPAGRPACRRAGRQVYGSNMVQTLNKNAAPNKDKL